MSCECDWCVPATAIAKRHADSTRRVRAGQRINAIVLKEYGVDLDKRRREEAGNMAYTTRTGYDEVTLDLLARAGLPLTVANKSAGRSTGRTDPNWERMLAVHAAAAAGDPSAMSAWAVLEGVDPGAARIVTKFAKASRPKANKSRPGDYSFDVISRTGPGSVGTVRPGYAAGGDEFEAFMASLQRGGQVSKSIGSQGAPRFQAGPEPDHYDNDPEFQAFMAQLGQGLRRF